MNKKWIWLALTLLVVALTATFISANIWYESGNVRALGSKLRVDLFGVGYVIDHETGQVIGQAPMVARGESDKSGTFDGELQIVGYVNEADGTLSSTQAAAKGEDGYWEIRHLENCQHIEENEDGTSKVVNHSCKYRYIYYVHPDKQNFLVARVSEKYDVYPLYVIMADSEAEALEIYRDFVGKTAE